MQGGGGVPAELATPDFPEEPPPRHWSQIGRGGGVLTCPQGGSMVGSDGLNVPAIDNSSQLRRPHMGVERG